MREPRRDGLKWGEGTITERPNTDGTIRYSHVSVSSQSPAVKALGDLITDAG